MNPKYLFTTEGKSSNMLCPFDIINGKVWDVNQLGWVNGNGYETPFYEVDNTGYQILTKDGTEIDTYAIAYDAEKHYLWGTRMAYNTYYPFATLDSRVKYVQISIPNTLPIEEYYFGKAETFDSWYNNVVNPIWSDDLAIDYEKESQQQFFRRKLSGKLTFVREDYTFIRNMSYDYKFLVRIMISYDNRKSWADYWKGHFYWTDCDFDEDNKNVRVTPSVDDFYTNILAGLEKEYNMIDLNCNIYPIYIKKRPILQIYVTHRSKIGCFRMDGVYWEQDCTEENVLDTLKSTYKFALNNGIVTLDIYPTGSGDTPDIPTRVKEMFYGYEVEISGGGKRDVLRYNDGTYKYEYDLDIFVLTISNQNDEEMWRGTVYTIGSWTINPVAPFTNYKALSIELSWDELILARLLHDNPNVEGSSSVPEDDMVADNHNYRYVMPYDLSKETIYYTDTYSSTPTKWGTHTYNTYYQSPPTTASVPMWMPIVMSTWGDVAYWFGYSSIYFATESQAQQDVILRNAYTLSNIISGLLSKFAPDITLANSTFSEGNDPITGDFRYFFITPKSNVININYDTPAMTAPIRLKDIFDMLRDCCKCYWYIDENAKLHIEHIKYFLQGHSYNTDPDVSIDLTKRVVTRNGKAWSFNENKYVFEKADMPARYQFAWMDEVTLPFKGEPLNIIGRFVSLDRTDDINISQFTSDVDYILMNPAEMSKDGFVLLAPEFDTNKWRLPFMTFSEMDNVRLQNAYCAFVYMQRYYLYDLPSHNYSIGEGSSQYTTWIAKTKIQEVNFPCPTDIDVQKLIKTSLGEGVIQKLSINLSSRNGKATLKYEP